jgi:D-proline reductase (dithiol) PrdB
MRTLLKITERLIRRKHPDFKFINFNDTPVVPLSKPLNECRLALVTTGGLHLLTDPPFDLTMNEGDPSYRILPEEVSPHDFIITHKWYDHRFIKSDINCVFPIDRMREYVKEKRIGCLSQEHFSFMGHIFDTAPLTEQAKKAGNRLKALQVDMVFLTPT